jgi:DNA-binding transcriptional LysR family regulator
MELRHLRFFVAVAEEGSLTTAAGARLHTSQPSLSLQIRDLEIGFQTGHEMHWLAKIYPQELVGEVFIGGSNKATVLRKVTEGYFQHEGLDFRLDHGIDNLTMAISLVASTRGLALMPAYSRNLLPWSVVSRPLEGQAPTIALAVGYSKANSFPILPVFLSRIGELRADALKPGLSQ